VEPARAGTRLEWDPAQAAGGDVRLSVIEIHALRKEFRRLRGGSTTALAGLDLEVPEGGVFGFLGPNGAGKTTAIRCVLGLVRPSSGSCTLLGANTQRDLASVIGRVGSIVETPTFFPRFSGRRNLELLGRLQGIGAKTVREAMDRVGLGDRVDDPVRAYSLGMRQRLGIAAALMKDPAVLILDEPANGLDPAGIKEVRELLRSLGKEGRTVFVSSHLLSEVQATCDRVAILSRGRLITSGAVSDVLATGQRGGLRVRLEDLPTGVDVLRAAGMTAEIDGDAIRVSLPVEESARVTRALAEHGLYLSELRPEEVDLETVFLELTEGPPPPRPDAEPPP
jgi:ABC-2 type transport system ATP-binding protein